MTRLVIKKLSVSHYMFYHAESKKERNSHINYENPLKAKQMATSSMFQSVIFKLKLAK